LIIIHNLFALSLAFYHLLCQTLEKGLIAENDLRAARSSNAMRLDALQRQLGGRQVSGGSQERRRLHRVSVSDIRGQLRRFELRHLGARDNSWRWRGKLQT